MMTLETSDEGFAPSVGEFLNVTVPYEGQLGNKVVTSWASDQCSGAPKIGQFTIFYHNHPSTSLAENFVLVSHEGQ